MIIAIVMLEDLQGGMTVRPKHVEMVREVFPDAEIYHTTDCHTLIDRSIKADILICALTADRFVCEDYLRYDDNLKWLYSFSAGLEGLLHMKDKSMLSSVRISNSSGTHDEAVADHVFCFILMFARRMLEVLDHQRDHKYLRIQLDELDGKTVALLGVGNLGRAIARKAKAFHMKVIGVKRSVEELVDVDWVYGMNEIEKALSEADFVVSTLPYTSETEKIMNSARFACMKKTAYFINVGRGGTVEEPALLAALQNGVIAGAGLDVATQEPMILPDDPLWDAPNLIFTPHLAAGSNKAVDNVFLKFQENARLYLAGEKMATEFYLDVGNKKTRGRYTV